MTRIRSIFGLLALLVAAPALADKVLVVANHTGEFSMMGQKKPAEDVTYEYWFGDGAIRFDMDERSMLMRPADSVMYLIDHEKKQYSEIKLPFDFEQAMGAENAGMMQQMMKMMNASTKVTPLDRKGEFGGYDCQYYQIDFNMAMAQSKMESCVSKELPVDMKGYREMMTTQAEMMPGQDWIKEMMKLDGFPVRTDTHMTMMGTNVDSWQELKEVDDREPPAGFYQPPAGYAKKDFDPMSQMHQRR